VDRLWRLLFWSTCCKYPAIPHASNTYSFQSFLRKLYPEVWWGAISSSGVPEAVLDYWQYNEAARLYAPKDCVETIQNVIQLVDNILLGKDANLKTKLKAAFSFPNTTDDKAFASLFGGALEGWQGRHWHPKHNSASVDIACANLQITTLASSTLEGKRAAIEELIKTEGSIKADTAFVNRVLNWMNTINLTVLLPCTFMGTAPDKCLSFGSGSGRASGMKTDIKQTWRSWPWQLCTEYVSLPLPQSSLMSLYYH
jgi:hypothetical protein